ncbi:family 43 glycosylhydrolase [Microbacterium karelineae]|uniref:family 43 glycosylhydrolase n=1 Tax=Microbacterium karelineae TaxID=2654283 RepID=UPI0018D42AE5|nr:family 43 glycosylhydrolase [Microbacterium karelineae]
MGEPNGSVRLLAYDRVPTTDQEANNADIALSVHLALDFGDGWVPLNENYGVFFAKTSEAPGPRGTPSDIVRGLVDPHIHVEPGGFGIVATRVARGGGSDGTQASSLLYARSVDLLAYEEIGLIDLGVDDGVNAPAAIYDADQERYVVAWTSDAGEPMHTTFADLADPATRGPVAAGAVPALARAASAPGVEDFRSGNSIDVPPEIARALGVRLGRIRNTSAGAFEPVELAVGEALDAGRLPARISLGYDDGSTGSLAVAWDADAIAAVDTSTPGRYVIRGSVRQAEYPAPFADERADPSIFAFDGNGTQIFLLIATEDLHMNPVDPDVPGGPHMPIRVGRTIAELSDEAIAAGGNAEIDLLRTGDVDAHGGVMTGCFWAPEFHIIDGTLSILFMPCYDGADGKPDMWTGRASIVQLKKDADGRDLDPSVPANWTAARHVLRADGSDLNDIEGISLDMTYFQDSGRHHYVWQMLGSLFLAEMDPADPTRLTTDPVRIIAPEYAWDNVIAEGANVLVRDGVIHMIYSGSSVGDTYTTGLATAPAGVGADLADPATWTRLNHPLQKSGPFAGEWQLGTGHGMWSTDEDGNDLYVFHARTDHNGLTGRDTFVRRVHWASDGFPVLDMEREEELAPEFRNPEIEVVVR